MALLLPQHPTFMDPNQEPLLQKKFNSANLNNVRRTPLMAGPGYGAPQTWFNPQPGNPNSGGTPQGQSLGGTFQGQNLTNGYTYPTNSGQAGGTTQPPNTGFIGSQPPRSPVVGTGGTNPNANNQPPPNDGLTREERQQQRIDNRMDSNEHPYVGSSGSPQSGYVAPFRPTGNGLTSPLRNGGNPIPAGPGAPGPLPGGLGGTPAGLTPIGSPQQPNGGRPRTTANGRHGIVPPAWHPFAPRGGTGPIAPPSHNPVGGNPPGPRHPPGPTGAPPPPATPPGPTGGTTQPVTPQQQTPATPMMGGGAYAGGGAGGGIQGSSSPSVGSFGYSSGGGGNGGGSGGAQNAPTSSGGQVGASTGGGSTGLVAALGGANSQLSAQAPAAGGATASSGGGGTYTGGSNSSISGSIGSRGTAGSGGGQGPAGDQANMPNGVRDLKEGAVGDLTNEDLVSYWMNKINDPNNPYIHQAILNARASSNSRGLMNSSIAEGNAEASAVQASLPIAAGNAQAAQHLQLDNLDNLNRVKQSNIAASAQIRSSSISASAQVEATKLNNAGALLRQEDMLAFSGQQADLNYQRQLGLQDNQGNIQMGLQDNEGLIQSGLSMQQYEQAAAMQYSQYRYGLNQSMFGLAGNLLLGNQNIAGNMMANGLSNPAFIGNPQAAQGYMNFFMGPSQSIIDGIMQQLFGSMGG